MLNLLHNIKEGITRINSYQDQLVHLSVTIAQERANLIALSNQVMLIRLEDLDKEKRQSLTKEITNENSKSN